MGKSSRACPVARFDWPTGKPYHGVAEGKGAVCAAGRAVDLLHKGD